MRPFVFQGGRHFPDGGWPRAAAHPSLHCRAADVPAGIIHRTATHSLVRVKRCPRLQKRAALLFCPINRIFPRRRICQPYIKPLTRCRGT